MISRSFVILVCIVAAHFVASAASARGWKPMVAPAIDRIEPREQFPGREVRIFGRGFTERASVRVLLFYRGDHPVFPRERTRNFSVRPVSDSEIRFTIPMTTEPAEYGVAVASGGLSGEVGLTIKSYSYTVSLGNLACLAETRPTRGSDDIVTMASVFADGTVRTLRTGEIQIDQGETKLYPAAQAAIARGFTIGDFLFVGVSLYENDGDEPQSTTYPLLVNTSLPLEFPDIVSGANRVTVFNYLNLRHDGLINLRDRTKIDVQIIGFSAASLQVRTNRPSRTTIQAFRVFAGGGGMYNVTVRITRREVFERT